MSKVDLGLESFQEEVIISFQQIDHKLSQIEEKMNKQSSSRPQPDKEASYTHKRNTYVNKLNGNEILYPKASTLEYSIVKKQK